VQHRVALDVRSDFVHLLFEGFGLVILVRAGFIAFIVGDHGVHQGSLGCEVGVVEGVSVLGGEQEHHVVSQGFVADVCLPNFLDSFSSSKAAVVAARVPVIVICLHQEPCSVGSVEVRLVSRAESVACNNDSLIILCACEDVVSEAWLGLVSEFLIGALVVSTVSKGVTDNPGVLLNSTEEHNDIHEDHGRRIFSSVLSSVLRDREGVRSHASVDANVSSKLHGLEKKLAVSHVVRPKSDGSHLGSCIVVEVARMDDGAISLLGNDRSAPGSQFINRVDKDCLRKIKIR